MFGLTRSNDPPDPFTLALVGLGCCIDRVCACFANQWTIGLRLNIGQLTPTKPN